MSQHNQISSKSLDDFSESKIVINVDSIANHINELVNTTEEKPNLFKVMPANRWMEQAKLTSIPKMLFSEFWFEYEICILFSDTNAGKSILGVQIGNSISKGEAICGFKLEAARQLILYYDFELSVKQFEGRYSKDYEDQYRFDDNFIRIEIDKDSVIPDNISFPDYLIQSLEQNIIETGAKVLIIDNITYLKDDNEKAKDALPLMKRLKSIKSTYNLSMLVLAHTPKRDLTKPITKNDLAGSKMLINFCDSSFSIGESSVDSTYRYLKQVKQRNTEQIFDADNVCVCQIVKPSNFLHFEFSDLGKEFDHLKRQTESDKDLQKEKVIELNLSGESLRDIALELGISHMKVSRILKSVT